MTNPAIQLQEENRGGPNQELPAVSVEVGERAKREIYFPGFRRVVEDGNVGAVVAAYNRVNGTYMTENEYLLQEVLKDEWGFEGFVVSDWGAVHSTVDTATSGLDVEMPGKNPRGIPYYWGDKLVNAVQNGEVSEDIVSEHVGRLLGQMERFDHLVLQEPPSMEVDYEQNRTLSRRVAEQGSVLLKNESSVLPLEEDATNELALIGRNPNRFLIGGGGSSNVIPRRRIGPVEGLENLVGDTVTITPVNAAEQQLIDTSLISSANSEEGFYAEYYDNQELAGDPVGTHIERDTELFADEIESIDGVSVDGFSTRWTGTLTAPVTGTIEVGLAGVNTSRLSVDGELLLENSAGGGVLPERSTKTIDIGLEKGETYDVTLESIGSGYTDAPYVKVTWDRPDIDPIEQATDAAKSADTAVIIGKEASRSSVDRDDIRLDDDQNELIASVADANDETVVLLNTAGPVEMPWISDVPSVLEMWFPGQEGGAAAANLLFGHATPTGRLPVTFGKSLYDYPANNPDSDRQYPGVDNKVYYDEGVFVGYRYFDEADIEPLFPFGHGESYTEFEYSNLHVTPKRKTPTSDTATAKFRIQNVGDRSGTETVQLYVSDPDSSRDRPPKELKAFEKLELDAGEATTLTFELSEEDLSFWNPTADEWIAEAGQFEVLIGSSSRDIRLQESFELVKPATTYYQVDFVVDAPIENLRGSEGTYTDDQLIRFAHGSTEEPITRLSGGEFTTDDELAECIESNPITVKNRTAKTTFTVAEGCAPVKLSLVSYTKPGPGWSPEIEHLQEFIDAETNTFGPGTHTLTVVLPGKEKANTSSE